MWVSRQELECRHGVRRIRPADAVLALPTEAWAALAGALLESLDETVDETAEAEWDLEIARRMKELDSGTVKPVAWAEARRQIAATLSGR